MTTPSILAMSAAGCLCRGAPLRAGPEVSSGGRPGLPASSSPTISRRSLSPRGQTPTGKGGMQVDVLIRRSVQFDRMDRVVEPVGRKWAFGGGVLRLLRGGVGADRRATQLRLVFGEDIDDHGKAPRSHTWPILQSFPLQADSAPRGPSVLHGKQAVAGTCAGATGRSPELRGNNASHWRMGWKVRFTLGNCAERQLPGRLCPLGKKRRPLGPKTRPAGVRQGRFGVRKCTLPGRPGGHLAAIHSALESRIAKASANRPSEGEVRFRCSCQARRTDA